MLAGVLPLLLAGVATSAAAQEPLDIDGSLIPAAVDTFSVLYGGHVLGHGVTEHTRVQTEAGPQLLQVYTWRPSGTDGVIVDSLFSDAASLRSVREVRVLGDTVIEVRFGDDAIRVTTRVAGTKAGEAVVPAGEPVYSSAALALLAAAGPLASGYEAEIRSYYAPPAAAGVVPLRLRVLASEPVIDRTGAERDAWVVHATTLSGGTTYWIDKQNRTVLQYDTREGSALIEFRR
jgi:hypothetical protein